MNKAQVVELSCEPYSYGQGVLSRLLGVSWQIESVRALLQKVGEATCPVLILGESGTGKGLVARVIHDLGAREGKPFVPVDCAAVVSSLCESELFGHVKGAFTNAWETKKGLCQAAQGGTLFLDEIGEMQIGLQAKLLRVMEEKEVRPVGSTASIPLDVRIIAATNRDLRAAIDTGIFRRDLYFRLNVVEIELPSLRVHKSDIPVLVHEFVEKFSGGRKPLPTVSDGAMQRLLAYDWPGNVRELQHTIQRAIVLGSTRVLEAADLPVHLCSASEREHLSKDGIMPIEELERRAVLEALRETKGNKPQAAALLGISKTSIYRILKRRGTLEPR